MLDLAGEVIPTDAPRSVHDRVHFSDLSAMALSPAHFKASVETPWAPSREMLVGTAVHHIVLGPHRTKPLIQYDGEERKGNRWRDFQAEAKKSHPRCDIVTSKEWDAAQPIAAAVMADRQAREKITGARREVSLQWTMQGVDCETDGIDIVGADYIADLKRTSCTEPGGFARHAAKHHWHCQIAFYQAAAELNGFNTSGGLFLIGVEPYAPYAVTVMRVPEPTLLVGVKTVSLWLEKLRSCRENGFWPTYTQSVVDFDLPPWMGEDEEDA